jgi:predicted Zn-dependent protease
MNTEASAETELRARELADEIVIGREMTAKFLGTFGDLNQRRQSLEYLNLIVQTLAVKVGRPEIVYRVGIMDSNDINAFAMPGGYILVTRGLLNFVRNEEELACVLAHEMGHINHRHLYKDIAPKREVTTGETLTRFLSRGGAEVTFAFGQAVNKGVKTLLEEGLKPELEYEADLSGMEYSWATGYDPRHYKLFLQRLEKHHKNETKNLLKTHPSFSERLKKMEGHLRQLGVIDTQPPSSHDTMKRRFSVLQSEK